MENSFLLYGANGYTGELIARHSAQYDLQPILAGRNEKALVSLSKRLNFPYRVIELDDTTNLKAALRDVKVVVHAAGPFQFTARQMIDACLETGTHYLDINGDIVVFEMLKKYDAAARLSGIMILPGVGFDVVPTDCIAVLLKKQLPDSIKLKLAFASLSGGLSHGTATTMANKLGEGGAVRKNGKIIRTALGHKGMYVDFGVKKLFVMSIPWGDIATAYTSTGIPNIETFTSVSPAVYRILKLQPLFNWLLRTNFIRKQIMKKIDQRPAGPRDEEREKSRSLIWGEVTNAGGKTARAWLNAPNGYTLTT